MKNKTTVIKQNLFQKDPFYKVVPDSGFREFKNELTGKTVSTFKEAITENDLAEKILENTLKTIPKKIGRMNPTKSNIALKRVIFAESKLPNLCSINELIRVRKEIAAMRRLSNASADKFQKSFMQMYDPKINYGLGNFLKEVDDEKN
ncbi:MAG: hypothetical protein O2871_04070 [bacterium]|nr:hypothetical protein [bacterium]